MEATIRLAGGGRLIKVEGAAPTDLFENMAMAYEVFNETECGLCGSENIRPVHRVSGKYHFYEYQCQQQGCRAILKMSQTDGGRIFPCRKLDENGKPDLKGSYGPHNGWTKYKGDKNQDGEGEQAQSASRPTNPGPMSGPIKPQSEDAVVKAVDDLRARLKSCGVSTKAEADAVMQMAQGSTEISFDKLNRAPSIGLAQTIEANVMEFKKKYPNHPARVAMIWRTAVDGGFDPEQDSLHNLVMFVRQDPNGKLDDAISDDAYEEFMGDLKAAINQYAGDFRFQINDYHEKIKRELR